MRRREDALLTEILPPEERVIEAVVARYQRVAPAVTRFARSLAHDDSLSIRLGSHAAAEPGEIVLDPGVFQAAYARQAPVTAAEVALASALHEVVHMVAEGDLVGMWAVYRGTPQGMFGPFETTGEPIELDMGAVHRIVDGKIVGDEPIQQPKDAREALSQMPEGVTS